MSFVSNYSIPLERPNRTAENKYAALRGDVLLLPTLLAKVVGEARNCVVHGFAVNISLLAHCAFAFIAIPLDCANMLGNKTWDQWIEEYSRSHRHPVNRVCHLLGIPIIVLSLVLILPGVFIPGLWSVAVVLFLIGWVFQFAGHIFERKPPEFFRDWRFLFVGLRWWIAKIKFR